MPEKGVSRTGNGSNRTARRKKRKNKKRWAPGRTGKVGTAKATAELEEGRAETRKEDSRKVVVEVEACTIGMGAYRTREVQGATQGGNPAPSEPNQEVHPVDGGASGVCTAAVSDS